MSMVALLKVGALGAVLAALSDPAWAIPMNTALLVILAVVNIRHTQEVKEAKRDAADAARIARELGGAMREIHPRETTGPQGAQGTQGGAGA